MTTEELKDNQHPGQPQDAEQHSRIGEQYPSPEHPGADEETGSPVAFRGSGYATDQDGRDNETESGTPGTGEIVTPRNMGSPTRP